MPRKPSERWSHLTWEVLGPAETAPETAVDDVEIRLAAPRLPGGGRLRIRFGSRLVPLPINDPEEEPSSFVQVFVAVGVTVEGFGGGGLAAETLAALRDVPLVSLVGSAGQIAREYVASATAHSAGAVPVDKLEETLSRIRIARGGQLDETFFADVREAIVLAQQSHPEGPVAYIARSLGVSRSTVQRWAATEQGPGRAGRDQRGKR